MFLALQELVRCLEFGDHIFHDVFYLQLSFRPQLLDSLRAFKIIMRLFTRISEFKKNAVACSVIGESPNDGSQFSSRTRNCLLYFTRSTAPSFCKFWVDIRYNGVIFELGCLKIDYRLKERQDRF